MDTQYNIVFFKSDDVFRVIALVSNVCYECYDFKDRNIYYYIGPREHLDLDPVPAWRWPSGSP